MISFITITALIIFLVYPTAREIWEDYNQFKKGENDTHVKDVWVRFMFMVCFSVFGGPLRIWGENVGTNILINFAESVAIFVLFFDYTLNIIRGKKWSYLGEKTTKWEVAKYDLILNNWNPYLLLIIKLIFFAVTTYFFITP